MNANDVVLEGLERIRGILQRSLNGLSLDDLHRQPAPDSNSIAWLAWHLTRVQDVSVSGLATQEQLWFNQGWEDRFSLPSGASDDGFGHTPEQVAAFRAPSAQALLDFHDAVLERFRTYVSGLTAADFDRVLDEPQWQPPPTVGVRLVSVLSDNLQHAGQAAYLRGLWQGKGWQRY